MKSMLAQILQKTRFLVIAVCMAGWLCGFMLYSAVKPYVYDYLNSHQFVTEAATVTGNSEFSRTNTFTTRLLIPRHNIDVPLQLPGHYFSKTNDDTLSRESMRFFQQSAITALQNPSYELVSELALGDDIIIKNHNGIQSSYRIIDIRVLDRESAEAIAGSYYSSALIIFTNLAANQDELFKNMYHVVIAQPTMHYYT